MEVLKDSDRFRALLRVLLWLDSRPTPPPAPPRNEKESRLAVMVRTQVA
jgi:hypothetical protein